MKSSTNLWTRLGYSFSDTAATLTCHDFIEGGHNNKKCSELFTDNNSSTKKIHLWNTLCCLRFLGFMETQFHSIPLTVYSANLQYSGLVVLYRHYRRKSNKDKEKLLCGRNLSFLNTALPLMVLMTRSICWVSLRSGLQLGLISSE